MAAAKSKDNSKTNDTGKAGSLVYINILIINSNPSILQLDKLEFGEVMDVCSNKKKMIAPIIITVIMVLYYVVYFGFLITLLPSIWKYALGIIPLGFSVVMVKVCIERINEIKKGEEDDISKYWLY